MLHVGYSHILASAEPDQSLIKSAHRVLQVFEFFAEARRPASATEICNALGFPQSSTSVLLRSLVALGYLDYQQEVRTFEPTIRLSLLGGWVPERIDVAGHIIELLHKLHEDTGESVVLAEQYRTFTRYISVVQTPKPGVSYYIKPGTLRPICINANGRMLLTLNSERDVLSILHRANAEATEPCGVVKRADLLSALEICRAEGYSYTERVREDRTAVQCAVLLPDEHAGRRLSVGVASEKERYLSQAQFIRDRLMDVARGWKRIEPSERFRARVPF
jgi:DNA-binding IclR family transcriptional regulator